MMGTCLRQLCGLSILCGAALTLTPEGGTQRAMRFVCAVVLLASVLGSLTQFDYSEYAMETALYREREERFLQHSREVQQELDRRVIESELETYILDKAGEMGLTLSRARFKVQWSLEGVWVPYSVALEGNVEEHDRGRLAELIEVELGIPSERQEWTTHE